MWKHWHLRQGVGKSWELRHQCRQVWPQPFYELLALISTSAFTRCSCFVVSTAQFNPKLKQAEGKMTKNKKKKLKKKAKAKATAATTVVTEAKGKENIEKKPQSGKLTPRKTPSKSTTSVLKKPAPTGDNKTVEKPSSKSTDSTSSTTEECSSPTSVTADGEGPKPKESKLLEALTRKMDHMSNLRSCEGLDKPGDASEGAKGEPVSTLAAGDDAAKSNDFNAAFNQMVHMNFARPTFTKC